MPKYRTLTTPRAGDDVEQQELSYIADGNAGTLKDSSAVSYKTKYTLII